MQIAKAVEYEGSIYYGLGIFIIAVAFFLLYAVKDVIREDDLGASKDVEVPNGQEPASNSSKPRDDDVVVEEDGDDSRRQGLPFWSRKMARAKQVLSILKTELSTHADFSVAILGGTVVKIESIALNQYGTLLISDSYAARGLPESEATNQARDHLSILFLIANLITMVSCILLGYLSDRVKIYKLMMIVNFFVVLFMVLLVYDVAKNPLEDLGLVFDIGFTLALGTHVCTFMLCITSMAKLCSANTRGSMFALNGLAGSTGILILQAVGGHLYDRVSKDWPFQIALWSYVTYSVVTLTLTCMGKLKI